MELLGLMLAGAALSLSLCAGLWIFTLISRVLVGIFRN